MAQVYPGFNFAVWVGMFSPKGTAPEIVSKLNKAFTKAVLLPEVRNTLAARGYSVVAGSPAGARQLAHEHVMHSFELLTTILRHVSPI